MAERIHPHESPAGTGEPHTAPTRPPGPPAPLPLADLPSRTMPPSGTFVVQIPKDQIYRVPSPDNARRFEAYTRKAHRRRSSCLACACAAVFLLLLSLAAAVGILYLVLRPESPRYSIDRFAVASLNLTSAQPVAPEIDVTVRSENPNKKIGIRYRDGSSVAVSYSGVSLCNGAWPAFDQGAGNVTLFQMALKGSAVRLSAAIQRSLAEDQRHGAVPLALDVKVPVRVKFGAVTSWTINVKVRCDITVDKLTVDSRIVSKTCQTKVEI